MAYRVGHTMAKTMMPMTAQTAIVMSIDLPFLLDDVSDTFGDVVKDVKAVVSVKEEVV